MFSEMIQCSIGTWNITCKGTFPTVVTPSKEKKMAYIVQSDEMQKIIWQGNNKLPEFSPIIKLKWIHYKNILCQFHKIKEKLLPI